MKKRLEKKFQECEALKTEVIALRVELAKLKGRLFVWEENNRAMGKFMNFCGTDGRDEGLKR